MGTLRTIFMIVMSNRSPDGKVAVIMVAVIYLTA